LKIKAGDLERAVGVYPMHLQFATPEAGLQHRVEAARVVTELPQLAGWTAPAAASTSGFLCAVHAAFMCGV
jgi:hypothetical protein